MTGIAEYALTAEDLENLAQTLDRPAWHSVAQLYTEYQQIRRLRAQTLTIPPR